MFGQMRAALGIDKKTDILDHCHSLPLAEQEIAIEKIRAIERAAMISQVCAFCFIPSHVLASILPPASLTIPPQPKTNTNPGSTTRPCPSHELS